MEEAINKFMEGMEQQEHTGYNALHKLLQGLPVPVQKDASSMTQVHWYRQKLCMEDSCVIWTMMRRK